jgi:hypothetical protein
MSSTVHSIRRRKVTRDANQGFSVVKISTDPTNTVKIQSEIAQRTKMQRVEDGLKNT